MSYNIEQADEQIRVSHNANEPGFATAAATRAVALATLELAEQQRIANTIAAATWNDEALRRGARLPNNDTFNYDAERARVDGMFSNVREALGFQ